MSGWICGWIYGWMDEWGGGGGDSVRERGRESV